MIDTRPARRGIRLIVHGFEVAGGVGGRVVGDAGVGEAPGAVGRAADRAGGVAGVGLKGDVARFEVDVGGDEVGALVADEEGVESADGVAEEVGAADEGEKSAAGGAHGEFLAGEVVG